MFPKILIANRGEIAVRIIRACKEMGVSTVAVYSQADSNALHVNLADQSYCIGGARAKDSYLNAQAIITVALASGCAAIHPGYGLLSESAEFVRLCKENGLVFIGPSSQVIASMGDKDQARRTMQQARVPVIPGTDVVQNVEQALKHADKIGYPVLIKARSGGGGKGIRLVENKEEFAKHFGMAQAEASASFGDGAVYLEKFLKPVKHIEMQIIGDAVGNVVCLGGRDCSVQRNNQKLIEESLNPITHKKLLDDMSKDAIKAAKAVDYCGVGTIEFLVDRAGNYYFMEMNTRLQVEHPVTEMVTGIDIVKWQIRVAAGVELTFTQSEVATHGHAIECRINAESSERGYMPSAGKVTLLHIPGGPWVRFDTALYQDYVIPPFYDSMIGKLIVHAGTREEAIRKMQAALCELVIEGVDYNRELQMEIMSLPQFEDGTYTTDIFSNIDIL